MPKIKVNDIDIYYEIHGKGRPIVFISGFSGDHTAWRDMIDIYAKNYQVIVFDNRGIGQSDCPDYPYTTEMMADDAAELIKKLGLDSVHLVGHSFGGCIAQTIAYKYPRLIRSIVLINTFLKCSMRLALYGNIRLELIKAKAPNDSITKFVSMLCWSNNYLSPKGKVEELVKQGFFPITTKGYEYQLNAMLAFNSNGWIDKINKPCLVITADEDLLADMEDSECMRDSILNSEYFCFNKTGHVPMVEHPKIFNKLLLEFISR